MSRAARCLGIAFAALGVLAPGAGVRAQIPAAEHAIQGDADAASAEVSTAELRRVLADGSALVLDARKRTEYAMSHIPGARSVAPVPGERYPGFVAAVEKLVGGDKSRPLVLYCNGPYCQSSRRHAEELVAAGFASVRRYQLGIPVWRALGGVTQTELEALLEVRRRDRSAVILDARDEGDFAADSLPGANNLPAAVLGAGGIVRALQWGLLPRDDFNARIIVYGRDAADARAVAEALAHSAFHNVAFYAGGYAALKAALK